MNKDDAKAVAEAVRDATAKRTSNAATPAQGAPDPGDTIAALQRLHELRTARKEPEVHVPTAPEGYHYRGVSTLVNAKGEVVQQWRKTTKDGFDPERFAEAARVALECLPAARVVKAPKRTGKGTLNVMPIGDPHFGMLAWGAEAGDDWDLKIASEVHAKAIARLMAKAPPAEEALVVWMGDNAHADDSTGMTPASRHILDVDSRWERMVHTLMAATVNSVEQARLWHRKVTVRIVKGNHDPHVAVSLGVALQAHYRNERRVEIDCSPVPLYVRRWGRNLLGFAHGHKPPPERIADILMADYREDIGATEWAYVYTGHKHSKILREIGGVTFEAVQTLAAKDAYAAGAGYRSGRGLFVVTYHKDSRGETDRCSVAAQDVA